MGLLHRLGVSGHVSEVDELAMEAGPVVLPELEHHADVFIGDTTSGIEVGDVERLELLAHPARTDPEENSSTGS